MKTNRKIYRRIGAMLASLLAAVFICANGTDISNASKVSAAGETLAAELFKDAGYTQSAGALTSDGLSISGWEYNTSLFLKINVSGLDGVTQHKIVVSMEPSLYLTSVPTINDATVSTVKNDNIPANNTGYYSPNVNSFKNLTYTLSSSARETFVVLELRYDNVLWNKKANAELDRDISSPMLSVSLQTAEGSDLSTLKLKQATTGSAMNNPYHSGVDDFQGNNVVGTVRVAADETFTAYTSQMSNVGYEDGHFYRAGELKIKITLPRGTVNGSYYTMRIASLSFPVYTKSGGSAHYDSVTETDSAGNTVITYTFYDTYYKSNTFINVKFGFNSADNLDAITSLPTFSGSYEILINDVRFARHSFSAMLDNSDDPVFKAHVSSGSASTADPETVQRLGTYGITNTGGTSEPVRVEYIFDSNNTNAIGVTTVRIMYDKNASSSTIKYTLTDGNGNDPFPGQEFEITVNSANYEYKTTTHCNFILSTDMLPEAHRSFYFKTLSYVINSVEGGTAFLNTSAMGRRDNAGGSFWGVLLANGVPAVTPENKCDLKYVSTGLPVSGMAKTVNSVFSTTTTSPYGLEGAEVSATTINAGESVTVEGQLYIISYPHSANSCLQQARIGLLLPSGVSVNEDASVANYKNGTKLKVESVTAKDLGNGSFFWTVQFEKGEKIGYGNKSLRALSAGDRIYFSIVINTEKTVGRQTIRLAEAVFGAGVKQSNGAGGSNSKFRTPDKYDLNGNNRTDDYVGCFDANLPTSFIIEAAPPELDISATVDVLSDGVLSVSSGTSAALGSFTDSVLYTLSIRNTSGGNAHDFSFIIPIATQSWENGGDFLIKQQVPFKLISPVNVINNSGTELEVLYTVDDLTKYTDAQSSDVTWYGSAAELPGSYTVEDVTAIKIISKNNEPIVAGTDVTVISSFAYADKEEQYTYDAGMMVEWMCRGDYRYVTAHGNPNSGSFSSNPTDVTLQVTIIGTPITLTATTSTDAANIMLKTGSFPLQSFKNEQSYRISDISATNVTLVPYDPANDNIADADSNHTFGIRAWVVQDGEASDPSSGGSIVTKGTQIGEVDKEKTSEFFFEIDNGNAISEIAEERTVVVTFVSDNGVIVKVTVTIKRQLTFAGAGFAGIRAGKIYTMFADKNTPDNVAASKLSAVTAQYSTTGLTTANYDARVLSFNAALPAGTSIVMIDWTYTNAPEYFYYPTDTIPLSFPLTDFISFADGSKYEYAGADEVSVSETFLFIFDIPDGASISSDIYATLTTNGKNNVVDDLGNPVDVPDIVDTMSFTADKARSFSLSRDGQNCEYFTFAMNYSTEISDDVTDAYYVNKKLAAVISSNSSLPPEARLSVNGETYYPDEEGRFIIPLEDVLDVTGTNAFTARYIAETQSSVSLKAQLWVSATNNGLNPMFGAAVGDAVTFDLDAPPGTSLKIDALSLRLLRKADLRNTVTLNYSQINAAILTLEVQRKENGIYSTYTNILNTLDGSPDSAFGVFTVLNDDGELTLKFSEVNTSPGIYRIVMKALDESGNEIISVPCNFAVTE